MEDESLIAGLDAEEGEAGLGRRQAREAGDLMIKVMGEGVDKGTEAFGQARGVGVSRCGVRLPSEGEKTVMVEGPHGHTCSLVTGTTRRNPRHRRLLP